MLKKALISSLAVAMIALMGSSSFTVENVADDPSNNTCCPPGWMGPVGWSHSSNMFRDNNGDGLLCFKDLPGKVKVKGNNQGPILSRNWKDNNQPCK